MNDHGELEPRDFGFDEFLLQLGSRLKLPLLDQDLERRAFERIRRYQDAPRAFCAARSSATTTSRC